MKRIILVFVLIISTMSCSKKDDNGDNSNASYVGSFKGLFANYDTSSQVMGSITIENNGKIAIDLNAGKLLGTAEKTNEGYSISIMEVEGIFQNIENLSGSLNTTQERLVINGTNLDGSSVTIDGKSVIYVTMDYLPDALKTAVYFQHYNPYNHASVTINGKTLNGLQAHYSQTESCEGGGLINLHNYDDQVSRIECYTMTIIGLDGNPLIATSCTPIIFILDKSTEYEYTVNWGNGETYTKKFTTGLGGTGLSICLQGGGNGGGNGPAFTNFTFQGNSYSYEKIHGAYQDCPPVPSFAYYLDNWGPYEPSLYFYNMPTSNNGSFSINQGQCPISLLFIDSHSRFWDSRTIGTITKTGANSFDFSVTMYMENGNEGHLISGSGVYR